MVMLVSVDKPTRSIGIEDLISLMLLLIDVIAMSLCFAILWPSFIVLGSVLAVSFIFNSFVLLSTDGLTRSKSDTDKTKCPSLIVLSIEILGVMAFLVLYVVTTIETAKDDYWGYSSRPRVMMTYASIGGLVAL